MYMLVYYNSQFPMYLKYLPAIMLKHPPPKKLLISRTTSVKVMAHADDVK